MKTGLIALGLLAFCAPVAMAQQDDGGLLGQAATCYNFEGKEKPEAVIAACTAVLKRPETTGDDRVDMLFSRAVVYEGQSQLDNALADYNEAIKIDPGAKELYFGRGIVWHKLGKFNEAITDYTQVIKLDPKNGDAYGNRGNVYQYGLMEYPSAIADYGQALAIRPHALEFTNRGAAYLYGPEDYGKAIADFTEALKLDVGDARTWAMRCWAKTLQSLYLDQAVEDCDKAVSLGMDKERIVFAARAIANYKWKKYQAAWNDFDAALKLAPGDPEHLYGRGLAAKALGKDAAAQADLAAAAKAEPDIVEIFKTYGVFTD